MLVAPTSWKPRPAAIATSVNNWRCTCEHWQRLPTLRCCRTTAFTVATRAWWITDLIPVLTRRLADHHSCHQALCIAMTWLFLDLYRRTSAGDRTLQIGFAEAQNQPFSLQFKHEVLCFRISPTLSFPGSRSFIAFQCRVFLLSREVNPAIAPLVSSCTYTNRS